MTQHNEVQPMTAPKSQAAAVEHSRAIAEVQGAITVARQFPRDMARATVQMREACSSPAMAKRAFYEVPNRGTGPTVHLMRELARIVGNIDYGVKELSRDDVKGESEIQAFAWDVETNVRSTRSFIVPHARMKGKSRQQLVDLGDIYLNNQNTGARAVRECIATVLPVVFTEEAKALCTQTLAAPPPGKSLEQQVAEAVEAFAGNGITRGQLEAKVGKPLERWAPADVGRLEVTYQTLMNGEITPDEAFPVAPVTTQEIHNNTQEQSA